MSNKTCRIQYDMNSNRQTSTFPDLCHVSAVSGATSRLRNLPKFPDLANVLCIRQGQSLVILSLSHKQQINTYVSVAYFRWTRGFMEEYFAVGEGAMSVFVRLKGAIVYTYQTACNVA